jgi:hypothetical protein
MVYDYFTQDFKLIKTAVKLSWLEAYRARKILADPFNVRLLWLMNGQITKVDLKDLTEEEVTIRALQRERKRPQSIKRSGSNRNTAPYGPRKTQTLPRSFTVINFEELELNTIMKTMSDE